MGAVMDRKALALALITATASLAACAGTADEDSGSAAADVTSFKAIGEGGGCVSSAPGRQGEYRGRNVRVRFSKGPAGPIALVESYDATTGLLSQSPAEYQYRRVSDAKVELYFVYSGDTTVAYTLTTEGGKTTLTQPDYMHQPEVALKCDLAAGGPSLSLATAQAPAAAQKVGASFPLPPDNNGGTCTATKLAKGKVTQLLFRREGKLGDATLYAHAMVYDAKTHLLEQDLLAGADARFVDHESSFGIESEGGESFATIDLKSSALVLTPKDAKLKEALGASLPLNCDFVAK